MNRSFTARKVWPSDILASAMVTALTGRLSSAVSASIVPRSASSNGSKMPFHPISSSSRDRLNRYFTKKHHGYKV